MGQRGDNAGVGEALTVRPLSPQTSQWLHIHIRNTKERIGMVMDALVEAIDTNEWIATSTPGFLCW
jgi:hypothetical protein